MSSGRFFFLLFVDLVFTLDFTNFFEFIHYCSYWLGSQATGQPIYQYRLIFPLEEKGVVNVSTDMDLNVEGEARYAMTDNISAKSNFVVSLDLVCADLIICIIQMRKTN